MSQSPAIFQCSACGRVFKGRKIRVSGGVCVWAPHVHWIDKERCAGSLLEAAITDPAEFAAFAATQPPERPDQDALLEQGIQNIRSPFERRLARLALEINRNHDLTADERFFKMLKEILDAYYEDR